MTMTRKSYVLVFREWYARQGIPWFVIVMLVLGVLVGLFVRVPMVAAACNVTVRNTTVCYAEPGNASDITDVFDYANTILARGSNTLSVTGGKPFGMGLVLVVWVVFYASLLPRLGNDVAKALLSSSVPAFIWALVLSLVGIAPQRALILPLLGMLFAGFIDYLQHREVV